MKICSFSLIFVKIKLILPRKMRKMSLNSRLFCIFCKQNVVFVHEVNLLDLRSIYS